MGMYDTEEKMGDYTNERRNSMKGIISYLKEGEGKRPASVKIEGDERWFNCWKLKGKEKGDTIIFDIKEGEYNGKPQYTMYISDEVPERDVSAPVAQPVNRDASIVSQNLINRATDRYIAELKDSALLSPEECDSEIKRHLEFFISLYHEARDKI